MRLCLPAVALAAGICVLPALAEKKKADNAPETTPQPAVVMPPVAKAAHKDSPQMKLPAPHFLENHPPQYFPEQPDFPLPRELAYQEETAGLLNPKDAALQVKSYGVADLVIPLPPAGAQPAEKVRTCEAELIEKITTNVEPKTWASRGGKGTIQYFPIGMALVVNQPAHVHAAVERYLDELRKINDRQVTMRLLVVTVSDAWFEESGLAKEFAGKRGKAGAKSPVIPMWRKELDTFLTSCQHDLATCVMQAPRITTLSGQMGKMKVDSAEEFVTSVSARAVKGQIQFVPKSETIDLGTTLEIVPTVSADGRYVELKLAATVKELESLPVPMTPLSTPLLPVSGDVKQAESFIQYIQDPHVISRSMAASVVLHDGGTAVFYGGKATLERIVKEPMPALAELAGRPDFFAQEKKQSVTNHLLLIATADVINPECEESCKPDPKLVKLLDAYGNACKNGKADEARRLAIECLAIDPTCFGKK